MWVATTAAKFHIRHDLTSGQMFTGIFYLLSKCSFLECIICMYLFLFQPVCDGCFVDKQISVSLCSTCCWPGKPLPVWGWCAANPTFKVPIEPSSVYFTVHVYFLKRSKCNLVWQNENRFLGSYNNTFFTLPKDGLNLAYGNFEGVISLFLGSNMLCQGPT